jgi:hypothetical protein
MLNKNIAGLYIPNNDHVSLTYVASGNGAGEIATTTFKKGGPSGTVVATLIFSYDADNNLVSVTRV